MQVRHLVDVLLQMAEQLAGDPKADVRCYTAQASARLQVLAAAAGAAQGAGALAEEREQAAADFEEAEQAAAAAEEADMLHAREPVVV